MAYSINPNLPKARAIALKLLLVERLPQSLVANKCGVCRTTIWRWHKKWIALNGEGRFVNYRAHVPVGAINHAQKCRWLISTLPSTPHSHPSAISKGTVKRILRLRQELNRCAEVIWHYAVNALKIQISLSSVRRILKRHHCFDGARKKRVRPDNPKRQFADKPGVLVQIDTIHHVDPITWERRYIYTVIDLYTRMAYAEIYDAIRPQKAVDVILEAERRFGFYFSMVQADNGPEFGRHFERTLIRNNIKVRHSRLGRPNDNAHIERFNRTLQSECIGHRWCSSVSLEQEQTKLAEYLDYYNTKRVHLGIQCRVPADMLQRC
jgi:transposase InsO family protein